MRPAEALEIFLRRLGVAGSDIPQDDAERSARLRAELVGRRMLLLLDNARDAEQVRPLLPGVPSCFVLVTSRGDSLAGLVARDGADRIELDLLTDDEAVLLLRNLIGRRADLEPRAVIDLARRCARLPLGLRITAELAGSRQSTPLASLVVELADEQCRLDRLGAGGDPRSAVRVVFSWGFLTSWCVRT